MKFLKTFEENIKKLNEVRENMMAECLVEQPPVPCSDCPYMWQGACLINYLGEYIKDVLIPDKRIIEYEK